jgi:hypothetical protein
MMPAKGQEPRDAIAALHDGLDATADGYLFPRARHIKCHLGHLSPTRGPEQPQWAVTGVSQQGSYHCDQEQMAQPDRILAYGHGSYWLETNPGGK